MKLNEINSDNFINYFINDFYTEKQNISTVAQKIAYLTDLKLLAEAHKKKYENEHGIGSYSRFKCIAKHAAVNPLVIIENNLNQLRKKIINKKNKTKYQYERETSFNHEGNVSKIRFFQIEPGKNKELVFQLERDQNGALIPNNNIFNAKQNGS